MKKRNKRVKRPKGVPSIMWVFGSKYKKKNKPKATIKSGKPNKKEKEAPIETVKSIHAISIPFGGMNKRY